MKNILLKSAKPEASELSCTVGVDVGGSFTKAVIIGPKGDELYFETRPTRTDGVTGFSSFLNGFTLDLFAWAEGHGLWVGAIGVGVPGIVHDNRITGGIDNLH